MAAAALPDGPRLAVLVLSSLTEASRRRRCFQRAATLSLVKSRRADGWLPLPHGGHLLLRYLISTEPIRDVSVSRLLREAKLHSDVWMIPVKDAPWSCFEKVVRGFRSLASLPKKPHYVLLSDDDTWIHPSRILQDLAPFSATPTEVMYGMVAFNAGWDRETAREFGNGLYNTDSPRLVRSWRRQQRRRPVDGPFPFAYGFSLALSFGLVQRLAYATATVALRPLCRAGRSVSASLRRAVRWRRCKLSTRS